MHSPFRCVRPHLTTTEGHPATVLRFPMLLNAAQLKPSVRLYWHLTWRLVSVTIQTSPPAPLVATPRSVTGIPAIQLSVCLWIIICIRTSDCNNPHCRQFVFIFLSVISLTKFHPYRFPLYLTSYCEKQGLIAYVHFTSNIFTESLKFPCLSATSRYHYLVWYIVYSR